MKNLFGDPAAAGEDFLKGEGLAEDYTGHITAASPDGVCFTDGVFRDWLPRSKILIDGEPGPDAGARFERLEIYTLTIPDWLARKKELLK